MPDHDSHHGYIASKDDYLKRLRRIEGQARGLQKMIEEEQYCIDILTQVSAMTRALQSVALGLLDEHLSHCVVRAAAEGGAEADIKIEEASSAIARRLVESESLTLRRPGGPRCVLVVAHRTPLWDSSSALRCIHLDDAYCQGTSNARHCP